MESNTVAIPDFSNVHLEASREEKALFIPAEVDYIY